MRRIVLDTNVLVSGIVGATHPGSVPGSIIRAWRQEQFAVVLSEHILSEASRALNKDYFRRRLSQRQIGQAIEALRRTATIAPITRDVRGVATHPEDDLVLATALSSNTAVLVSGDVQIQRLGSYEEIRILSPRQFLEELTAGS